MEFPSFTKPKYFVKESLSVSVPSAYNGPELGEIIKLYSVTSVSSAKKPEAVTYYLADVFMRDSKILYEKMVLPGPHYTEEGNQAGHKQGYFYGQACLIVKIGNRADSPIVVQVFSAPLSAMNGILKQEEENSKSFHGSTEDNVDYKEIPLLYDPSEISTGNAGGHKTVWKPGKTIFQDKAGNALLTVDYDGDAVTVQAGSVDTQDFVSLSVDRSNRRVVISDLLVTGKLRVNGLVQFDDDYLWDVSNAPEGGPYKSGNTARQLHAVPGAPLPPVAAGAADPSEPAVAPDPEEEIDPTQEGW